MIEEKKIEEAKKAFIADKKVLGVMAMNDLACGFKAGAHWAIKQFLKDLWHDASVAPRNDYGSIIAYSTICGQGYSLDMNEIMDNSVDNNYFVMWNRIVQANKLGKWFYLEDLLSKQKGGKR